MNLATKEVITTTLKVISPTKEMLLTTEEVITASLKRISVTTKVLLSLRN